MEREKESLEGVGKIGGKLGRSSFLPVGKEVVSMRRGKFQYLLHI